MQIHRPHPRASMSEYLAVGSSNLNVSKISKWIIFTLSQNYCLRPYALWPSTLVYYISSLFLDLIYNHFLDRRSGLHLSIFHGGFGTKCAGFNSWHLIHAKRVVSSSNSWISKPWFTLIWPRRKITSWLGSCTTEPVCVLYPLPPTPEWITKSSNSVFPIIFHICFSRKSHTIRKQQIFAWVMFYNSRVVFMCLLSFDFHGNPVK